MLLVHLNVHTTHKKIQCTLVVGQTRLVMTRAPIYRPLVSVSTLLCVPSAVPLMTFHCFSPIKIRILRSEPLSLFGDGMHNSSDAGSGFFFQAHFDETCDVTGRSMESIKVFFFWKLSKVS